MGHCGHDVLTPAGGRPGKSGIPDDKVLAYATTEGRAVLTFNRGDFIPLHKGTSTHGGIIVCTFTADFVALAEKIHAALESAGSLEGILLRVNRGP